MSLLTSFVRIFVLFLFSYSICSGQDYQDDHEAIKECIGTYTSSKFLFVDADDKREIIQRSIKIHVSKDNISCDIEGYGTRVFKWMSSTSRRINGKRTFYIYDVSNVDVALNGATNWLTWVPEDREIFFSYYTDGVNICGFKY